MVDHIRPPLPPSLYFKLYDNSIVYHSVENLMIQFSSEIWTGIRFHPALGTQEAYFFQEPEQKAANPLGKTSSGARLARIQA